MVCANIRDKSSLISLFCPSLSNSFLKGAGDYRVVRSAVLDEFASGDVALASDHLPVYVEVDIYDKHRTGF